MKSLIKGAGVNVDLRSDLRKGIRVGYRGRLGRLKSTLNFDARCNLCPGGPNHGGPTLDNERKPTLKYVLYPTLTV